MLVVHCKIKPVHPLYRNEFDRQISPFYNVRRVYQKRSLRIERALISKSGRDASHYTDKPPEFLPPPISPEVHSACSLPNPGSPWWAPTNNVCSGFGTCDIWNHTSNRFNAILVCFIL